MVILTTPFANSKSHNRRIFPSSLVAFFLGTLVRFAHHEPWQIPAVYAGAFAGMCSSELIGGDGKLAVVATLGSGV